ncbi:MAG: DUF2461 domain-containing protein [Bacteroidota bacterium]
MPISPSTFDFLNDLKANNTREWFQDHKARYEAAYANVIDFADGLLDKMNEHDHLVPMTAKKSLFRIYRDVRFSKDKSPYKNHWGGRMKRATEELRGGYYYHIEPGNSFVAGGFWAPDKEDLKRIRDEFAADADPIRAITADPDFVKMFGQLKGDAVKTAPKGFSKEHPNIDLIRMKQFIVTREFSDESVLQDSYVDEVVNTFLAMRPYFDYMSEVLTTNANGA